MNCTVCKLIPKNKFNLLETEYWVVSLNPDQYWLGRSFITSKKHIESISNLSNAAWLDLKLVINAYEAKLKTVFGADVFNWSALMNDAFNELPYESPHLHWHVRPRYSKPVIFEGTKYEDEDFGRHYRTRWDGRKDNILADETMNSLAQKLAIDI